jgi:putative ABC transport system permease protein
MTFISTFSQAIVNVTANKRRTIFVICLIGISTCSLLLMDAFVTRVYWGVRESVVRSQTGHLQIMSRRYDLLKGIDSNKTLFEVDDQLLARLKALPHVVAVTRRIDFKGLVGNQEQSTVFSGVGVEPREDAVVSSFDRIVSGRSLQGMDQWHMVAGYGIAQGLNLSPGQSVVVTTVMPQGGLNASDFEITGIAQSDSSDYDQHMLKVPLSAAQRLLNTDRISKIVILLDKTEATLEVRDQIQKLVQKNSRELTVKDWHELNPQYDKIVALYTRIFGFIAFALVLLSALSIGNVMSLSFLERIREFSVMRAIGMRKSTLVALLMTEGATLALFASLAGIAAAWMVTVVIIMVGGIQMPPPPGSNRGFSLLLHIDAETALYALLVAMLVGLASCVLVAVRALYLRPAHGLRHA